MMSHPVLSRRTFLGTAFASALGLTSRADDIAANDPHQWAQFLGPRRDGIIRETGLNIDWTAKQPATLWKVPLGAGFSSVAVVGDRLYTMAKRGERDGIACLAVADGKEVWWKDGPASYIDVQRQGAGPRSTPTYHHGKLYCLFPMGELLCVSADGKELWQKNMFQETGAKNRAGDVFYWGVAQSPLVEADAVIVQPGGDKGNSIVAFHKDTGKKLWSVGDDPIGYSSPIAITAAGRRQVVVCTGQSVVGLDPAKGTLLWRYAFGNRFDVTCATPQWIDDVLFVSAAYGVGCAALKLIAEGDTIKVEERWRNRNLKNQFTTSVVVQGHVYGSDGDLGAISFRCLDLKTGAIKWQDRRPGKCGLLAVDRHLLCVTENGTLRLIEADPARYVPKAELADLLTYKTWAAPALLNGRLYLRDDKHLLCLDLRKD
jgi:outer membrane protein assembly factor BamB